MDTNRKVFRDFSPTLGAELRGIFGRNFNYSSTSLRRFIAQYIKKSKPSHIPHRPIEVMPTIPRVHLLDANSIVFTNQLIGNLEVKISSLVIDFLMGFGDKNSSLSSAVRAFDPTRKPSLSHCKQFLRLLKEAWVFYFNPIRGSQEGLTTDIYSDSLSSLRQWLLRDTIARKAYIPLASRTSADSHCFNITLYRARQPELEPAYLSNRQIFAVKLPASLLQGEAIIPVSPLESGEACLPIAVFHSTEETRIGFIQPLKHLLKHLRAYFLIFKKGCLQLRELFNLVKAGDRVSILSVDSNPLLKGSVVESPAEVEPVIGLLKCLRVRQKTILKGLFHLPSTIFNIAYFKKGVKQAFIPPLKGWVFPLLNITLFAGDF